MLKSSSENSIPYLSLFYTISRRVMHYDSPVQHTLVGISQTTKIQQPQVGCTQRGKAESSRCMWCR